MVFEHLELLPKIEIKLKPSKVVADAFLSFEKSRSQHAYLATDAIEDIATKLIETFKKNTSINKPNPRTTAALQKISRLEHHGIFKLQNIYNHPNESMSLIFDNGSIHKKGPDWENWDTDEWIFFLKAGFLDVDNTVFYRKELKEDHDSLSEFPETYELSGEYLSSGQWSWLAGFVGLCAEISNDSLILVDEPENSLHPIWQQNYLPTLQAITSEFPGTQTIIATHSPLIASGINPDNGNVLALKSIPDRKTNRTLVTATPIENTYGWAASDVYQEAFGITSDRAPSFTATADLALSLIRKNKPLGSVEASLITDDLTTKLESLPLHDPLRNVLKSIITRLKELIRGEP